MRKPLHHIVHSHRLATVLEALSRTELATLIVRLDHGCWPARAAAISTMSDPELEHALADLEAAARAVGCQGIAH